MSTAHPQRVPLVPDRLRDLLGERWAEQADTVARDLAHRWSLTLGRALDGGALSLCLDALTADAAHVVLKVPCVPAAGRAEAAALDRFPPGAVPPLLARDHDTGAVLLGFIPPSSLVPTPVQAIRLARHLHTVAPTATFVDLDGPLTTRLAEARHRHATDPALAEAADDCERAAAVIGSLLANTTSPVLLHGDFQDKNILVPAYGSPVAIDPIPAIGDPLFDLALWAITRRHHQCSVAHTLTELHGPDRAANDRLDRWAWALAAIQPYSPGAAAWGWQRDFVTGYRHLADPHG